MNTATSQHASQRSSVAATVAATVADIVNPAPPDGDPPRGRLTVVRQVVALVGAAATLVQVIVWLMIAILGGGLDAPWWLWSAGVTAVAVAALTVADRSGTRGVDA